MVTVGELTREIRSGLESRFSQVSVQGEVSNLVRAASGHVYFTLKDSEATLSAVLFKGQARLLRFDLQSGQKVVCRGRITLYPPRGQYQLACEVIEPSGLGALALAFEQLKDKLAREGLFDPARKRSIPVLPRHIGVVTSPQGAAVRDFLRVLHHRFPGIGVLIAPARVQGAGAGAEIARALEGLVAWSARAPAHLALDVVVVTRGGGSIEDLWAFNEEVLARAIAACPIPVVSAVGHEVDFTIADFVADLRCPTPTAAAEQLAPERLKERELLAVRARRLNRAMDGLIAAARHALLQRRSHLADPRHALAPLRLARDAQLGALTRAMSRQLIDAASRTARLKAQLAGAHPRAQLLRHERALRGLRERLAAAMRAELARHRAELERLRARHGAHPLAAQIQRAHRRTAEHRARLASAQRRQLTVHRGHFEAQQARLQALSPLAVMSRGYAIAFGPDGRVLRRSAEVRPGDRVEVRLAEGVLSAQVEGVRGPSVE